MNFRIVNFFLIGIAILFPAQAKHHKHKNNGGENYSTNNYNQNFPYLIVDAIGNCYTQDNRIYGRCTHYQHCHRAVKAWNEQHIYPVSCSYTAYENIVCCPNEQPPLPPIISQVNPIFQYWPNSMPQNNNPHNQPYNVPYQRLDTGYQQQTERVNERVCSDNYLSRDIRRKRDIPKIDSALNKTIEVTEEPIKKQEVTDNQVVGGTLTYENQYPYMCALGWKSKTSSHRFIQYNCGCVLIAPKFILTAAHCATLGGESPSIARLGGVDLDERHAELIKVKKVIQHPNYIAELSYHDIAIIKLEHNSRKTPACLWNIETLPQEQLIALGYGQTRFAGKSSNNLLQVTLNILTNQECSKHYRAEGPLQYGIGPGQICAGAQDKDTCQGDSGGPLMMQSYKQNTLVPYIVGLTSLGEGCAGHLPGIYTRISNYIDWIEDIVWS